MEKNNKEFIYTGTVIYNIDKTVKNKLWRRILFREPKYITAKVGIIKERSR